MVDFLRWFLVDPSRWSEENSAICGCSACGSGVQTHYLSLSFCKIRLETGASFVEGTKFIRHGNIEISGYPYLRCFG